MSRGGNHSHTGARRVAVGYKVRRPMTINGVQVGIGETLTDEQIASITRFEGCVATGKVVPIWEDAPQLSGPITMPEEAPKPKKRTYTRKKKTALEEDDA